MLFKMFKLFIQLKAIKNSLKTKTFDLQRV